MKLGRSFCATYVLPGIFPDGPANHSELISARGVTLLVPDLLKADPPFFARQNVARFSLASRSQGQGWSPQKKDWQVRYTTAWKSKLLLISINFTHITHIKWYTMLFSRSRKISKSRHFLGETTAFFAILEAHVIFWSLYPWLGQTKWTKRL